MSAKRESTRPIRVLVAKPGLDGHDVGAKVVVRALREAGMQVVYTGLRQSPQSIVDALEREGSDVLALSILSGAHLPLGRKVGQELAARGAGEGVLWVVGGNIPASDHAALKELGVAGVFATGSSFEEIVRFIQKEVQS